MATRKSRTSTPPTGGVPQPANEGFASHDQTGLKLEDLAVPAFDKVPPIVENRTALVDQHFQDINLKDAELLMRQVQAAQRNLTESLNLLSLYRKSVARVLESRRRDEANLRKAQQGQKQERKAPEAPFKEIGADEQ